MPTHIFNTNPVSLPRKRLAGKWVAYRAAGMTVNGCTVCGRTLFGGVNQLRRIGHGWLLCRGGQHREGFSEPRKRLAGKWAHVRGGGMTVIGCTFCGRNSFDDPDGRILRSIGKGWRLCRGGQHREPLRCAAVD